MTSQLFHQALHVEWLRIFTYYQELALHLLEEVVANHFCRAFIAVHGAEDNASLISACSDSGINQIDAHTCSNLCLIC